MGIGSTNRYLAKRIITSTPFLAALSFATQLCCAAKKRLLYQFKIKEVNKDKVRYTALATKNASNALKE